MEFHAHFSPFSVLDVLKVFHTVIEQNADMIFLKVNPDFVFQFGVLP